VRTARLPIFSLPSLVSTANRRRASSRGEPVVPVASCAPVIRSASGSRPHSELSSVTMDSSQSVPADAMLDSSRAASASPSGSRPANLAPVPASPASRFRPVISTKQDEPAGMSGRTWSSSSALSSRMRHLRPASRERYAAVSSSLSAGRSEAGMPRALANLAVTRSAGTGHAPAPRRSAYS
jgi:hypothetical protein